MEDALATVRQTREALDPGLLERVREAIGAAVENYQSDRYRSMHADKVPVDQKKNLTIVMKYMEMNPDNKALQQELRTFLTRH